MPDLSSFQLINVAQQWHPGQPVVLVSLHTSSNECRNVAPYYVQLAQRFPRIYFLHISFQSYDEILNTIAIIPELMRLNIAHDAHRVFKTFMFRRNGLAIPYMFIFNNRGTMLFEGHPLAKPVETHLHRLSGLTAMNNTIRPPSPLRRSLT